MQVGDTYTRGTKTWRVTAIDGERVTCRRVYEDAWTELGETATFVHPRELTEGSLIGRVTSDEEAIAMIRRDVADEEIDGAIEYYRESRKSAHALDPWRVLWIMALMAKGEDDE